MEFTNINVKSHYSLLNSTLSLKDIIKFAVDNDFKYVSICDENYLSCALELKIEATKNNLIPIIGLDFTLKKDDILIRIHAFATNYEGFKNLEKISSILVNKEDFYLEEAELDNHSFGLIYILDLLSSSIYQNYLLNEEIDKNDLAYIQNIFNDYYFYVENDEEFKQKYIELTSNHNILIAKSIHYLKAEDYDLYMMLNALRDGKQIDKNLLNQKGASFLQNYKQIKEIYSNDEIINTDKFLKLFDNYDLELNYTLPLYKNNNAEINEYLKKLSYRGLQKRLNNNITLEYQERLLYELNVVKKMGYSNYFLIVYDYVLFAKKNNILVGPGRGSSAGSLIAYCLGITDVDPIKNSLLFERFLNPERISLPDIDVDFQDDKRNEIIEYLKDKYGKNNIAHIITFGTFQAKNSIRDLGRVLDYPNYRIDLILRLIPDVLNVRLIELLKTSNQLQILLNANDDLKYLYNKAIGLEGINRHISTHAAGIIISDQNVENYAPIMSGLNDTLMVQYTMDYLENIGLYKMDILGLRNLSIISSILECLEQPLRLADINLSDKKTLDLVSMGQTLGIFQFESAGVIKVLKKMKVDSLDDMVATTALFRPGPMQYIDEYIDRKNNNKSFSFLHDDLKPILQSTYGIIVYQEQIMQICQIMAGFSLAKADIVRKGMAKKDKKILENIKNEFVEASIKRGYSQEVSQKVYDMILLFSDYGFNKAHAYSYGLLGYYMAYLKVNYPHAFYESVLSANTYNEKKLKQYFYEMKQLKLKITNPKINVSTSDYIYSENEFIMPLLAIKGMGQSNVESIINERTNNGEFKDYLDCIIRLVKCKINRKLIESLIYAGALDEFEYSRMSMIENIEKVLNYAQIALPHDNQVSLELDFIPKPKIIKYHDDNSIITKELDVLGLYVSKHPLDVYAKTYSDLTINNFTNKRQCLVYIDHIKEIRTKKGELMAFIQVSDQVDTKTLVVFPSVYQRYKARLSNKKAIVIKGKIDDKDQNNIIVNEMEIL